MKYTYRILMVALVVVASPVWAKKDSAVPMKPDIAAVVGQEVISTYDLENRIRFVMSSSNLPMTNEVRARIRPQVIRALVDERLQLREADSNGIKVADNEVQDAILSIEKDRALSSGTIYRMLDNEHIPKNTFTDQIRAQLAWRKLVLRKIRPLIKVNDDEVQLVKLSPSAAPAPQEIKMAALTLPVDKPTGEKEVLETALKLAKELRAGASFEEVSRQLANGAVKGSNDAFWVHPSQLAPPLARALVTASAGMISEPIRTEAGYTLIKVYETRTRDTTPQKDSEVTLKEILIKPKATAAEGTAAIIAEDIAKNPGGCEEKTVAGAETLKDVEIEVDKRVENLSGLSPTLRTTVAKLNPGEVSAPQTSSDGVHLFMLCARKEQSDTEVAQNQIKNRIFQQKIELEAQKYLRNLRRNTFCRY